MPIPSSGEIKLNDDINATLQADTNEQDVSLKDNNAVKFTDVGDGSTVSGRSMSELRGQTLFAIMPENEETGNIGESLHMDGITSNHNSIDITDNGAATAAAYTATEATFSFWVKIHETESENHTFYSAGTGSSTYMFIGLNSSGTHDHKIRVSINSNDWVTESFAKDKTGWYNFVVSVDTNISGPEQVKVYGNGLKLKFSSASTLVVGTGIQMGTNQKINDWDFSAGYGLDATYANFVYVDGNALLPNEFGELKYGIWVPKQINKPSTDTLITTNLTANYDFVLGSIQDTSGNGNHLTKTGTGGTASQNNYGIWTTPGSNSSFLNMPDIINSHSTTISMWVHPNSLSTTEYFFHASKEIYGIWDLTNGKYNVYFGPTYIIQNIPAKEKWTMLTLTTTGARDVQFYIDGNLVNTRTDSSDFPQNYNYYSNTIGYTHHTVTPENGEMNFGEIQVYSTGLTAAQVLQNYNATKYKYFYGRNGWHFNFNNTDQGSIVSGSNLKIHLDAGDYDADGTDETGSGTAWSDLSGNNNTATLTGGAAFSTDSSGSVILDGTNDYVNIPNSATFDAATSFTTEQWVYFDNLTYLDHINTLYSTTVADQKWYLRLNDTEGDLDFYVYNSAGQTAANVITNNANVRVKASQWNHVVATFGDGGAFVYINGGLAGSATKLHDCNTGGNGAIQLGQLGGYAGQWMLDGKVAQYRFYDKQLTATEVVQNYRATQGHYSVLSLADISSNAKIGGPTGTNLSGADHSKEKLEDAYPNMVHYAGVFGFSSIGNKIHKDSGRHLRGNDGGFISDVCVNTGKWYWEIEHKVANTYFPYIGVTSNPESSYNAGGEVSTVVNAGAASKYGQNSNTALSSPDASFVTSGSSSVTAGTIISLKLDLDAGNFYLLVNGVVKMTDTGLPSDGSKFFHALVGFSNAGSGYFWNEVYVNFGQKAFSYAVPSGYKTLSSANLPVSTNVDPVNKKMSNDNFEVKTYTGLSDPQKIDTLKFKPDLLLIKRFDGSDSFQAYDSIRGPSKQLELTANSAEYQQDGTSLLSFNSDGFSLGADASQRVNDAADEFVAYAFKAGGDAVANSNGNIASQVSVNTTAGFSIVKYTGNEQASQTIGHGLSSSPEIAFIKQLDGGRDWTVPLFTQTSGDYMQLNDTGAKSTDTDRWSAVSSTTFTVGADPYTNGTGSPYIGYFFHSVDGYQKIGTYLGNGSSDHPIYTGFEPVFVMIKNTANGYSWIITDASRGNDKIIYTNLTQGQDTQTNGVKHMNSNGFTLGSAASFNNDGDTFVYLAIAKDPYKYSQGTLQTRNTLTEEFIDKKDGTSTLLDPGNHRRTVGYIGNGSKQIIDQFGFKPDFALVKSRGATATFQAFNSIAGESKFYATNGNGPEYTYAGYGITHYTPKGFVISGATNGGYGVNGAPGQTYTNSAGEYVAYGWKAGDTQVTKKPTYTSSGILTSNLVLHYNFADSNTYAGTGTTVYDLTSNDNDGTLTNSPTWIDRANGNYFDFDGSNDYITKSGQIPSSVTNNYSIEAWVNVDDITSSGQSIFKNWYGSGAYVVGQGELRFHEYNGDKLRWYRIKTAGASNVDVYDTTINVDSYINKWIHIVLINDVDGAPTLYINGILTSIPLVASTYMSSPSSTTTVGGNSQGSAYFNGGIGQLRVYTAELTQAQIRANYDATRTLYQGVGTTGNVLQTGLLNNIDVDSFSSYDPNSFGTTNKVAVFNGANSSSRSKITTSGLTPSGNFSISFWINSDDVATDADILMGTSDSYVSNVGFGIYTGHPNDGDVTWAVCNGSSRHDIVGTGVTAGQWHHIAVTQNTSNNEKKLYINGALSASSTNSINATGATYSLIIGGYSGFDNSAFDGQMDQIRVFSSTLTADQIKILYNETSATTGTLNPTGISGCIALYNFNSDTGTTIDDVSTNYDGTFANGSFAFSNTTSGRAKDQTSNNLSGAVVNATFNKGNNWGTSIKFDGTGDYVILPEGLGRTATQDVTRELWIKVDDYPSSGQKDTFFYCGDMSDNGYYETISVKSDGTLQYQERNNSSSNTGQDISVTTPGDGVLINENVWYHIAYTVSGKKKSIYINGEIAANDSVDYTKVNNSSYPASLGAFRGSYAAAFHGEIAQFRSYTSALTEAQIKANYDATRAQFFSALTHSLVSVNDKAGFSIARYESTGTSGDNVSHGLSEAPDITIFKSSTDGTNWITSITNIINNKYLYINNDGTGGSGGFEIDKNSIFLNNGFGDANTADRIYYAFSWRSIPGYSKISYYKGDGGTANNVYTGFKPGFLMIKLIESASQNWYIMDTSLYGDSVEKYLITNSGAGEVSLSDHLDITSDGFTLTKNSQAFNTSGYRYLYMAFV